MGVHIFFFKDTDNIQTRLESVKSPFNDNDGVDREIYPIKRNHSGVDPSNFAELMDHPYVGYDELAEALVTFGFVSKLDDNEDYYWRLTPGPRLRLFVDYLLTHYSKQNAKEKTENGPYGPKDDPYWVYGDWQHFAYLELATAIYRTHKPIYVYIYR